MMVKLRYESEQGHLLHYLMKHESPEMTVFKIAAPCSPIVRYKEP